MFLIRLMHLSSLTNISEKIQKDDTPQTSQKIETVSNFNKDTINQIKNVSQEIKIKSELQTEVKSNNEIQIDTFQKLLEVCTQKKEIKLKFELEKNVNLVSFEKNRVEISFNENLDKNFIKDLSLKLYEWTGVRWIITLSKVKGEISIKEKEQNKKIELLAKLRKSELHKNVLEKFPDAKLVEAYPTNNKKDKE